MQDRGLTRRVRLSRQVQLASRGSLARRAPLALALLASAAACRGSEGGPAFTARDSAGIRIAESRAPAWPDGRGWTVADSPEVQIGVVTGDSAYQLFQVRGARRLSAGTIVVANGGTNQLRIYGPDGHFLRSVGGSGDAPGEFRALSTLATLPGDTILAFDWRAERLSVFGPAGRLARTVSFSTAADGRPLWFAAAPGAGRYLCTRPRSYVAGRVSAGATRDTLSLVEVDGSGKTLVDVGRFPGGERSVEVSRSGDRIIGMTVWTLPLAHSLYTAAGGDRFFVSSNERFQAREYDRDGKLVAILRRTDVTPTPVTDAMKVRATKARLAIIRDRSPDMPAERVAALRKSLESLPAPATEPVHGPVLVDPDGNVWIRDYSPPWAEKQPGRWSVFDPDGRWLGAVTAPAGLDVYEIGADYLLGAHTDDLQVEHVQMYALRRGS